MFRARIVFSVFFCLFLLRSAGHSRTINRLPVATWMMAGRSPFATIRSPPKKDAQRKALGAGRCAHDFIH